MKWCIVMVALIVAAWLALRSWRRYLVRRWMAEYVVHKAKPQERERSMSSSNAKHEGQDEV